MNDKVHLGAGTVYLEGYDNVDVSIPEHHLASDRPDIVDKNRTTVDNYYKRDVTQEQVMSGELHKSEVVVDKYGNVFDLPYEDESLSELRLVQVFEHLTFEEGKSALKYWLTKLKKGGVLHLDIPDLDGTIEVYKTNPEWATRLLFGSQRNEYGQHKSMYSKSTISKVLEECGYVGVQILGNIHFYPAFAVEAKRPNDVPDIAWEGQGYIPVKES